MNGQDKAILTALIEGDLSAGFALLDRLAEVGDTRLDRVRSITGRLITRVIEIWQDAAAVDLDYDNRVAAAMECDSLLERAGEELTELFWVELLSRGDVELASRNLAESIRLVSTEFERLGPSFV